MSKQVAQATLARMNLREQAIAPHYQGFANDMHQLAMTDPADAREKFMNERRAELCAAYGFAQSDDSKPFAFSNGVAIIPVSGTLINRFGGSYGWITGYNFIRAQHNAAVLDPDVTTIIHDHNSYGGEAAGCFELSDDIYNSRGTKPILAVVDSNCYSASYALASAADKIIVTPSGGVGSIGVCAMHVDQSEMLKDFGINITMIYSGDHKVDGNPYEALPDDVKANIQSGVDKSRAVFVNTVARNRDLTTSAVFDTQAQTYRAEDALALGLIDLIAPPSQAMTAYYESVSEATDDTQPVEVDPCDDDDDNQQQATKESPMTTETAAPAVVAAAPAAAAPAAAAAAPAVDEKARIKGIQTCAEAEGRTEMANHLAFNTSMPLAEAQALLAVAPKAGAAAAAAPAAAAPNAFAAAMSSTQNPNVGADAQAGAAGGDQEAPHLRILRAQELATGVKLIEQK